MGNISNSLREKKQHLNFKLNNQYQTTAKQPSFLGFSSAKGRLKEDFL